MVSAAKTWPQSAKALLLSQDDGLLFLIAFADGLEEQAGMHLFEREIADFVDDEQCGPGQILDLAGETVFGDGASHASSQIDGGGEVDAVSHMRSEHTECDRQMRLAHTRLPEEDDVAALVQEASGGQLVEDAFV